MNAKPGSIQTPFSGGCYCGAIRYECTAPPITMFKCHCRTCQQVTGGPYSPVVLVPAEAFRLTRGVLRYHFTASLAGRKHKRGFCADCGSRISGGESDQPSAWVGLVASSLDDPSWFRPERDIFTSRAQPWDLMDPKLPKHEQYPLE